MLSCRPKSRLAQIFREQRDLAEDAEDIEKSPDDTIKSCSAAADALFAQLPFHTSRDGQQVQQEDETEQNDTDAPRTKEKQTQLETADFFIRKFAGAGKPGAFFSSCSKHVVLLALGAMLAYSRYTRTWETFWRAQGEFSCRRTTAERPCSKIQTHRRPCSSGGQTQSRSPLTTS